MPVSMRTRSGLFAGVLLFATACDQQSDSAASTAEAATESPAAPAAARPAASLAYEHRLAVTLSDDRIEARARALQDACLGQRFGACVVMDASVEGGDAPSARIAMRGAPSIIEPLVKLSSDGGDVAQRTTRAEDLAMAMSDNALQRDRLEREHARLLEFQARRDMKLGDVIALSERLAAVEAQLETATREAAQQRHRVQTQLLTIELGAFSTQQGRSAIGRAMEDFAGLFNGTVSVLIRAVAVLLPVLLVALLLAWSMPRALRLVRRRRSGPA